MRKIEIFISYCGADQPIKEEIARALSPLIEEYADRLDIEIVAMDTHCAGNWAEWMIGAVKDCEVFVPILTDNSMHSSDAESKKRVFEEARTARNANKEMAPYATCKIPDEMQAHIGSFSASSSIDDVVRKTKILLDGIVSNKRTNLRASASLAGFRSAQSNRSFVGRCKELEWLDKALQNHNLAILTGEGGIGKTTLAECFFQTHRDKYSHAYIVDASNGVRSCIASLPFDTKHITDEDERYAENKRLLCALDSNVIIILDNCDVEISGSELDDLLDETNCKIIITSRKGDDGRCVVDSYRVGRMANDDLLELVRAIHPKIDSQNGLTREETDKALIRLFELVDGHTLTVEMASAIMKNSWVELDEITQSLLECEETARTRKFETEQTIKANLGALYDFARLSDAEKRILNALCLVSPLEGIEFPLLKKILGIKSAKDVMSLVKNTFARRDEETDKLSMHPLFADVYYAEENVSQTPEYEDYSMYLYEDELDLFNSNDVQRALRLCEYFIKKRSAELEDREIVAWIMSKCGDCLGSLGKMAEALSYNIDALEMYREIYESEGEYAHEFWVMHNTVGNLYCKLGEPKKAQEIFEAGLELYLSFEEKEGLEVATGYNNLAMASREAGNDELALEYQLKANEIFENTSSEDVDDEDTLKYMLAMGYDNLGVILTGLARFDEAIVHQKRSLEIRQELYRDTPNHVLIAQSYNNIGNTYTAIGRTDLAIDYMKKALEGWIAAYGEDSFHPNLGVCYNNIGNTYMNMGQHDIALEYLERALEILLVVYEDCPTHSMIGLLYSNIGTLHAILGDGERALEYIEKALEILSVAYAECPTHINIMVCYVGRAMAYACLGDNEKSLANAIHAQELAEIQFKDNLINPSLVGLYTTLADAYLRVRDPKGELDARLRLYEILNVYYDRNSSPIISNVAFEIGRCYAELKDYGNALKFHTEALVARKAIYKDNLYVLPVANSFRAVALACSKLKDYQRALDAHKNALSIYAKIYQKEPLNPNFATQFDNVGIVLYFMGNYEEAIKHLLTGLKFHEIMLKNQPRILAEKYQFVARCYDCAGDIEKAREYREKAKLLDEQ